MPSYPQRQSVLPQAQQMNRPQLPQLPSTLRSAQQAMPQASPVPFRGPGITYGGMTPEQSVAAQSGPDAWAQQQSAANQAHNAAEQARMAALTPGQIGGPVGQGGAADYAQRTWNMLHGQRPRTLAGMQQAMLPQNSEMAPLMNRLLQ